MTISDWFAATALVISGGGLAIQIRNWMVSAPRLILSTISEAEAFPDDGEGTRATLMVTNRGAVPTMLTHMVSYTYQNRWKRLINKPTRAGIVVSPNLPEKLGANEYWIGYMFYTDDLRENMKKGKLYLGIISSHSNKRYLVRLTPPKETNLPAEMFGS